MVTHSMAQAASLGDRLIMAHQGRFILDVSGAAKHRLRHHDLLEKFEELRRSDQLDETAAAPAPRGLRLSFEADAADGGESGRRIGNASPA